MLGVPIELLIVALSLAGAVGVAAGLFAYLGKISRSDVQAIYLPAAVGLGVLIAPLPLFLAIVSAGAGEGHYVFARLFFPYTVLLTRLTGNTISLPLIILALAQFPLYGGLIGLSRNAKRAGFAAALIFVAHAAAAAVCFSGAIPNFS
ncbi:MAG TPA: hypothetical protein VHX68_13815 [Planctomycetaceae bacterium]|jgi:hypothetical protein|nr:hypothetical protein [Planctomycetaceae bacterium]